MKSFVNITLILFFLIAGISCNKGPRKVIGVKIYEYNGDFDSLAHKWRGMGINTAFVSKGLVSDPDFRKALKDNNINVFIIFPVFYDTAKLRHDSLLYSITNTGRKAKDDWVEFICPSRKSYIEMKINEAGETVRKFRPDGLSIDFIREFVFWEMIYPDRQAQSIETACFCDTCISDFCKKENIILPDSIKGTPRRATYIMKNYAPGWYEFRTGLITSTIKQISDRVKLIEPGIKINVHTVPWRDYDFDGANIRVAAQDLHKISPCTDFISPMCYSQMLRRDDKWIASVVSDMDQKAPGKILPSIQVYPYYVDDPFSPEDFSRCIDAALQGDSRGVVFFSWPLFEKDPQRIAVVEEKHRRGLF